VVVKVGVSGEQVGYKSRVRLDELLTSVDHANFIIIIIVVIVVVVIVVVARDAGDRRLAAATSTCCRWVTWILRRCRLHVQIDCIAGRTLARQPTRCRRNTAIYYIRLATIYK